MEQFQRSLPRIRQRSSASELRCLVTENQRPRCFLLKQPNMDSAESNKTLLLQIPGCAFDLESKPCPSFPFSERFQQDECVRDVDEHFG